MANYVAVVAMNEQDAREAVEELGLQVIEFVHHEFPTYVGDESDTYVFSCQALPEARYEYDNLHQHFELDVEDGPVCFI